MPVPQPPSPTLIHEAPAAAPALAPSLHPAAQTSWTERVFLAILAAQFLCAAVVSLVWPIVHDFPLMLYVGRMMDQHGLVPYRDIFDMNPPGAHFLHAAFYHCFGLSDRAYRIYDLNALALLMGLIVALMRPWGRRVGLCGALLFGIAYLNYGPYLSLQREFLCLPALLLGLWLARGGAPGPLALRGFLIGLLLGAAASVKPHLLIASPILFAALLLSRFTLREVLSRRLPAALFILFMGGVGVALVPLLSLVALARLGGWPAFREIVTNYWPLYSQLDGDGAIRAGLGARLLGLFTPLKYLFLQTPTAGLALLGLYFSIGELRKRPRFDLLAIHALLAAGWLYVSIGGKFWDYHYLPALLFACMLGGFSIRLLSAASRLAPRLGLLLLFIITLPLLHAPQYSWNFFNDRSIPVKDGDVEQIADYLMKNLRHGETVQPLDTTGGALHAMLIAYAPLATPFIYDFYFYHDPANPYVASLRRRFIQGLREKKPRFIIQFLKPWRVHGPGAADGFPELDALLASDYHPSLKETRYWIWERK